MKSNAIVIAKDQKTIGIGAGQMNRVGAAIPQLVCPVGLAIGIFARLSSLGLFSTMAFAVYFHLLDTGLEGFPLAVVEGHNYAFELSFIYGAISLYFLCAGPGRLSLFRKTNKITYYPKST